MVGQQEREIADAEKQGGDKKYAGSGEENFESYECIFGDGIGDNVGENCWKKRADSIGGIHAKNKGGKVEGGP